MTQQKLTVGRGEQVDIFINDLSVSKNHLTLERLNAQQIRIVDQGSTNGTYLLKSIGKIKLTDQIVSQETPLILGQYQTTPRQLLEKMMKPTPPETVVKPSPTPTPFTRYVRAEDGSFGKK